MRLTEKQLYQQINKHVEGCDDCQLGNPCEVPEEIEAAFYNEVDRQIDEAKEGRDWD